MADRWEDYFAPGERLIWEGQPMPGRSATPMTIGLAIFGIPFFLAGLAVSGGALLSLMGFDLNIVKAAEAVYMFFFGLPFLGMGGGLVFGPWYALRNAHRKIRYALSDQRADIATSWWSRRIEVLPILRGSELSLQNGKDVYFHTRIKRDGDGDRVTEEKGFENIADAAYVYQLMREIQDGQGSDA